MLILLRIKTLISRERTAFCEPCVNDVLNGKYHHLHSDTFWVEIGARRYEIKEPEVRAA